MSDIFPDPSIQPTYRISGFKGFLPLAEESSLSTRGQKLPGIISSRSSSNLADLRHGSSRRPSWIRGHHVDDTGGQKSQDDADVERAPPVRRTSYGLVRGASYGLGDGENDSADFERRMSHAAAILRTPEVRSQRLIGNSNPRYRWEQYYKTEEDLEHMKKPLRKYYERNNYLIQQYMYIDRLLDSSLPHHLIQEYNQGEIDVPPTIHEEGSSFAPSPVTMGHSVTADSSPGGLNGSSSVPKVKRTPKDIYKVPDEDTPLLDGNSDGKNFNIPEFQPDEEDSSGAAIVTVAIYINLAANSTLLVLKIIVTIMTSSLSVLASLVDAALDFLSTFIVWTTTFLISRDEYDTYNYPVGRRRLEPIGVLVFSVIMITSFAQVALEAINRLMSKDHTIVQLSGPAIAIMASTVVIKGLCWLWCRLIRNSSVQALAQDAITDVVFNTFSIIFPLVGFYAGVWWLDPLGGLLLSLYVIISWSMTSRTHILNLTGHAASKDERNILLYLTMRFAHTIQKIQGLSAYHAGDKLNVEVDIVLSEEMSLRDSHDLSESLQYVLESVPGVERAFVHADYKSENLPNHMRQ